MCCFKGFTCTSDKNCNGNPGYKYLNDETGNNESTNVISIEENTAMEDSNTICDQI